MRTLGQVAMMMSMQQQSQIPTAPLTDRRNMLAYLQAGYRICCTCELFVKWPARHCPFCHQQMRVKPRNTRSRKRYVGELTARPTVEIKKDTRFCSNCQAITTGLGRVSAKGKKYPAWYSDGKGGNLCASCYHRAKAKAVCIVNKA